MSPHPVSYTHLDHGGDILDGDGGVQRRHHEVHGARDGDGERRTHDHTGDGRLAGALALEVDDGCGNDERAGGELSLIHISGVG